MKVLTSGSHILQAIGVSIFRTTAGTVLGVFLCSLFAYALSRKNIPGKKYVMYLLIFIILFNGGLIPTYLAIKQVNLLDNIWVYVIPNLINAWNVIIIKQSMENIPKEVEESAQLDGVNDLRNFSSIILPMSKPVLAAMAIFTLVGQWNSWFDAMLYISPARSGLWPLQYYATISLNNLNQINAGDLGDLGSILGIEGMNNMSIKMALTIITCLPVLLTYPFFQKYFTKGVYLGAVKG
jgi:ABC-type glycerol-3-phosphate transport system permease component